jgi:hypothetical protein
MVKNSKSALMALAAAGGLWAWRNRDKIQSWVSDQRGRLNDQLDSQRNHYESDQSFTGETRRMDMPTYDTPSITPPTRSEPFISES